MRIGGRYTPFTEAYKPQVFMRTADVTCRMKWPEGTPDPESKMVSTTVISPQRSLIIAIDHAW